MYDIINIGRKYQIVISKNIREKANIKEGDRLFIDVIDNTIVMLPLSDKISDLAGIGKGLYGKEYIKKLRKEWD
ncbi:MAG: AbrB/MazE/SpoVT family DNA-binding domain-containing protein [bacterium]